jgi:hypothetical protein
MNLLLPVISSLLLLRKSGLTYGMIPLSILASSCFRPLFHKGIKLLFLAMLPPFGHPAYRKILRRSGS